MCIACELGYLSIIDALEAERNALREREKATKFTCEPGVEPDAREQPSQSADEPTP
ncbi:MAG TPA: hypothetical protein VHQ92_08435 [Pseudolabrys sp.]|jgi:hypothetical protein|nr:hypothetical protein [Pseudolabrys sp.]